MSSSRNGMVNVSYFACSSVLLAMHISFSTSVTILSIISYHVIATLQLNSFAAGFPCLIDFYSFCSF